jgi:hypothetical protein
MNRLWRRSNYIQKYLGKNTFPGNLSIVYPDIWQKISTKISGKKQFLGIRLLYISIYRILSTKILLVFRNLLVDLRKDCFVWFLEIKGLSIYRIKFYNFFRLEMFFLRNGLGKGISYNFGGI